MQHKWNLSSEITKPFAHEKTYTKIARQDGDDRCSTAFAGGFGRVKPCLAPCGGDSVEPGFGLVGIPTNDDDLGASAGKSFGHGTAEFAGAADNDGDLAG